MPAVRLAKACFIAGFFFLLGHAGLAAATPVRMYCSEHTVPKHFAEHGRPAGYGVDLGLAILRQAGIEAEAYCMPWARAIQEVAAGKGIMAPVFSKTAEREQQMLFSHKVMDDPVVLVQAAARPFAFRHPTDLAGRRVGTTRASRFADAFNAAMPSMLVNEDGGPQQRLQMLVAGRLDAAVIAGGVHAVRYNARQAGIVIEQLRIVSLPIMLDPNYFAVSRHYPGARAMIARLNATIARMRQDRSLNRLLAELQAQY
ncbi:transporter substrate-binding domain-containing protein [Vogesella sp. DC21W]|uniref:Transporter substrate-binding domain-containing protein n=1 Tax=Vogesella aquatica TaxID=2984206 RepID=A0ABT5IU65_9NEIS|nr:transporter substrate-binding domain-containing protein [Vogesella aquatica]MDC7716116.1 transporter substrate-binding domain-containing protein [Vogesella aquatica]